MDGTTAGRLELARPAPRPTSPDPTGSVASVAASQPSSQASSLQPQFSQLTPVYAQAPVKTLNDIPQPAVKGIEFVQTPTPVQPVNLQPQAPVVPTLPPATPVLDQPFKLPTPTVVSAPIAPVAAPTPPPPMPPANPEPFKLPTPSPTFQPNAQTPVENQDNQLNPDTTPDLPEVNQNSTYESVNGLVGQLDQIDLDQKMAQGTTDDQATIVPVAPAVTPFTVEAPKPVESIVDVEPVAAPVAEVHEDPTPEPTAPAPVEPVKIDAAQNYFQTNMQPTSTIGDKLQQLHPKNMSPQLLRIIIIAAIVLVIGVVGVIVVSGLSGGGQKTQTQTPTTTTSTDTNTSATTDTPAITEPDFAQAPTTTTDTPTTTETPTTPAVTTPTPTPTVTPTPVASQTVPTVANSGISDEEFALLPRYLRISKLNINAHVEQVGVTAGNAMGVPSDMWNAGWYVGSAKPGQGGAAFMDGHSTASRNGLFGKLDTLAAGDKLEVQRNDGVVIKYTVAKVSVVNRHKVDMAAMLQPYNMYKNGLNILSCAGQWIESEKTLENRVLVYAVQD